MTTSPGLIVIGRVVKPQGRKGEVLTESFSDRPDRFPSLERAFVPSAGGAPREIHVTHCWPHKGRFVLKLAGVDSIDDAEAYRGAEISVPEADLEPLPAGTYYHHELIGLRVEDPRGKLLGLVSGLLETGADAKVLVVQGKSGEALYPLVEAFVKQVDLSAGRLILEPQEMVDVPD